MAIFDLISTKKEEEVEVPRALPTGQEIEPEEPRISPRDELEIAIRQLKELRGTI